MNLTTLKAQAEAAKTDSVELELWRESIEPDEFLRLVEVARAALDVLNARSFFYDGKSRIDDLRKVVKGIEP